MPGSPSHPRKTMPKKVENVDKRRTPLDASNLALARVPALLAIRGGGQCVPVCLCVYQ